MNEDLITNDFFDHVDKKVIGKIVTMVSIILFMYVVYSFLNLLQWYLFLKNSLAKPGNSTYFYDYRIMPALSLLLFIIGIIAWSLNLRSVKMVYTAVENINPEKLNKGYKLLYKSSCLTIAAILVGTILLAIKFILHS